MSPLLLCSSREVPKHAAGMPNTQRHQQFWRAAIPPGLPRPELHHARSMERCTHCPGVRGTLPSKPCLLLTRHCQSSTGLLCKAVRPAGRACQVSSCRQAHKTHMHAQQTHAAHAARPHARVPDNLACTGCKLVHLFVRETDLSQLCYAVWPRHKCCCSTHTMLASLHRLCWHAVRGNVRVQHSACSSSLAPPRNTALRCAASWRRRRSHQWWPPMSDARRGGLGPSLRPTRYCEQVEPSLYMWQSWRVMMVWPPSSRRE